MIPVASSSNVVAVAYDAPTKILTVEYKGGAKYAYKDVTPDDGLHIETTAGDEKVSTGGLINSLIKGQYEYERIDI